MTETCHDKAEASVHLYYATCTATFAATLFLYLVYQLTLKERLEGAPALYAQFLYVAGSAKILVGVLLFFVFRPVCPAGCFCVTVWIPPGCYPLLCVAMGAYWIKRGLYMSERAKQIEAAESDPYGVVFEMLPNHDDENAQN